MRFAVSYPGEDCHHGELMLVEADSPEAAAQDASEYWGGPDNVVVFPLGPSIEFEPHSTMRRVTREEEVTEMRRVAA